MPHGPIQHPYKTDLQRLDLKARIVGSPGASFLSENGMPHVSPLLRDVGTTDPYSIRTKLSFSA